MSKEDESEKNWKYSGDESEWDSFDRRMIRYMRKRYDVFEVTLWITRKIEMATTKIQMRKFT